MVDSGSTNVHLFIIGHLGAITTKNSCTPLHCHHGWTAHIHPCVMPDTPAHKDLLSFPLVQQVRNTSYSSLLQHITTWLVSGQRDKDWNHCYALTSVTCRLTQMPLSSHSTSAEIRVAWHHQKSFQPELWNTPCRFDSVNTYTKCLPRLLKHSKEEEYFWNRHTHLPYPGSMKI